MPVLTPGKPVSVSGPELLVENRLTAGRYRFQLVVTDDSGLESAPAELVVTVQPPVTRPTGPVLRPSIATRVVRPNIARPLRPIRRTP